MSDSEERRRESELRKGKSADDKPKYVPPKHEEDGETGSLSGEEAGVSSSELRMTDWSVEKPENPPLEFIESGLEWDDWVEEQELEERLRRRKGREGIDNSEGGVKWKSEVATPMKKREGNSKRSGDNSQAPSSGRGAESKTTRGSGDQNWKKLWNDNVPQKYHNTSEDEFMREGRQYIFRLKTLEDVNSEGVTDHSRYIGDTGLYYKLPENPHPLDIDSSDFKFRIGNFDDQNLASNCLPCGNPVSQDKQTSKGSPVYGSHETLQEKITRFHTKAKEALQNVVELGQVPDHAFDSWKISGDDVEQSPEVRELMDALQSTSAISSRLTSGEEKVRRSIQFLQKTGYVGHGMTEILEASIAAQSKEDNLRSATEVKESARKVHTTLTSLVNQGWEILVEGDVGASEVSGGFGRLIMAGYLLRYQTQKILHTIEIGPLAYEGEMKALPFIHVARSLLPRKEVCEVFNLILQRTSPEEFGATSLPYILLSLPIITKLYRWLNQQFSLKNGDDMDIAALTNDELTDKLQQADELQGMAAVHALKGDSPIKELLTAFRKFVVKNQDTFETEEWREIFFYLESQDENASLDSCKLELEKERLSLTACMETDALGASITIKSLGRSLRMKAAFSGVNLPFTDDEKSDVTAELSENLIASAYAKHIYNCCRDKYEYLRERSSNLDLDAPLIYASCMQYLASGFSDLGYKRGAAHILRKMLRMGAARGFNPNVKGSNLEASVITRILVEAYDRTRSEFPSTKVASFESSIGSGMKLASRQYQDAGICREHGLKSSVVPVVVSSRSIDPAQRRLIDAMRNKTLLSLEEARKKWGPLPMEELSTLCHSEGKELDVNPRLTDSHIRVKYPLTIAKLNSPRYSKFKEGLEIMCLEPFPIRESNPDVSMQIDAWEAAADNKPYTPPPGYELIYVRIPHRPDLAKSGALRGGMAMVMQLLDAFNTRKGFLSKLLLASTEEKERLRKAGLILTEEEETKKRITSDGVNATLSTSTPAQRNAVSKVNESYRSMGFEIPDDNNWLEGILTYFENMFAKAAVFKLHFEALAHVEKPSYHRKMADTLAAVLKLKLGHSLYSKGAFILALDTELQAKTRYPEELYNAVLGDRGPYATKIAPRHEACQTQQRVLDEALCKSPNALGLREIIDRIEPA